MVAVVLGELIAYGEHKITVWGFVLTAISCVGWLVGEDKAQLNASRIIFPLILGMVFIVTGYLIMDYKIQKFDKTEETLENDGSLDITGVVTDAYTGNNGYTYVAEAVGIEGKIMLYSKSDHVLYPGMKFETQGEYMPYTGVHNDGNFDDRTYYRSENISARFVCDELKRIGKKRSPYREFLFKFKEHTLGIIYDIYGERYASVYAAVLLGDKSNIDDEVKDLYKTAGIFHLVCISGSHMATIGLGIYRLVRRRHRYLFSGAAGIAAVIVYGMLTGMAVSVVRSVIMLIVRMCGDILGRTYDMMSSMSLAFLIMVWINPYVILNSGFILSYGAVASICMVLPRVEEFYSIRNKISKAFVCSFVIQLFTMPMIAYFYFEIPVYGVLMNMILVPCMEYVIFSGFLSVGTAFLQKEAGKFFAGTGNLCLTFYDAACGMVSAFPDSEYITGKPDEAKIGIFYAVIMIVLIIFRQTRNPNRRFWEEYWYIRYMKIALGLGASAIICLILISRDTKQFVVRYIDVGQGDSIYLHMEDGASYLIDGGSSDIDDVGKYRILPVLKSNGEKYLDYIIVTHCDSDHINGLETLISEKTGGKNFVKNLVLPCIKNRDEAYTTLERIAAENGINVIYIKAGDAWKTDDYSFKCIYPNGTEDEEDKNELSTVMLLSMKDFSMMFTGDLGEKGENRMLKELQISKCSVLKVGHHGSRGSSSQKFLDEVMPQAAIISCGINNSYGHPHNDTLERLEKEGAKIYVTAKCGQITISRCGSSMRVKCMNED